MVLTIPTKVDLEMYRGDDGSIAFTHSMTPANVAEARFYVRKWADGPLVLALTLTGQPAQWSIGVGTGTVTILPADMAGLAMGNWVYDIELTDTSGVVMTVQRGACLLLGDVAD